MLEDQGMLIITFNSPYSPTDAIIVHSVTNAF